MFLEHDQICSFVVQLLNHVLLFVTSWTSVHQASLCFTISWSLCKLKFIKLMMPSNHLILCCSLLLLPSIFPTTRVFCIDSGLCIRWPSIGASCFSIRPFKDYLGLISFRIDWFDFPAVQGTLKSLLQYHSSEVSVLQCPAIFMVQISHPYKTTGKTVLTIQTFVGKEMSPLF